MEKVKNEAYYYEKYKDRMVLTSVHDPYLWESDCEEEDRKKLRDCIPEIVEGEGNAQEKSEMQLEAPKIESEVDINMRPSDSSVLQDQNKSLLTRIKLYKEALYTAVHSIGSPTPRFPSSKEEMSIYTNHTFGKYPKEQQAVMDHILSEPFPVIVINTYVKKGEELELVTKKDKEELPNSYCLIAVETDESLEKKSWQIISCCSPLTKKVSKKDHKSRVLPEEGRKQIYQDVPQFIRTTIQRQTRNPVWDQKFQCLAIRPHVDTLTVEVWDHDDREIVDETIKAVNDHFEIDDKVEKEKGKKALEIMKLKGKISNYDQFLGRVTMQAENIPSEGEEKWHFLRGYSYSQERKTGRILIQVWLTHAFRHGHKKDSDEYWEPKVMLEYLWFYILRHEFSKVEGEWDGEIPAPATCLLFQYALQTGISEDDQATIRWNSYARYHLGLYGTKHRVSELQFAVKYSEIDAEGDHMHKTEEEIIKILFTDLLPIIKNHLFETQLRVKEAINSIKNSIKVLAKCNSKMTPDKINSLVSANLKMGVLKWYESKFNKTINLEGKDYEMIGSLATVVDSINILIYNDCKRKWAPLFLTEGSINYYLTSIYEEFQKMIIHDVERLCWQILNCYNNNRRLRMIVVRGKKEDRDLSRAFFTLYLHTQIFVDFQKEILKKYRKNRKNHITLKKYYVWFRPILSVWLGFAFLRIIDQMNKALFVDEVIPIKENSDFFIKRSTSSLDTILCFKQLMDFWNELKWPNMIESFAVLHFILEVLSIMTILYTQLKGAKIASEGYFEIDEGFYLSDKLCMNLNNIEYVKDHVMQTQTSIFVQNFMNEIDKSIGRENGEEQRVRLESVVNWMICKVEKQFTIIMDNLEIRLAPDIRKCLKEMVKLANNEYYDINDSNKCIKPLTEYMTIKLSGPRKMLLDMNFLRILESFWRTINKELLKVLIKEIKIVKKETSDIIFKIRQLIPAIAEYFINYGLTDEEIKLKESQELEKFFIRINTKTETLVSNYLTEQIEKQKNYKGRAIYGELKVHVTYHKEKLEVTIISGKNLLPMDPSRRNILDIFRKIEPTSDPRVEIEILPSSLFKAAKLKTAMHKRTLNPIFNEKLTWALKEEYCKLPTSVIHLIVMDVDVLTKNDFMGEAWIQLNQVPGIAKLDNEALQPMNLTLQSMDDKKNLNLIILKSRKWDKNAQDFVKSRYSNVIQLVSKNSTKITQKEKCILQNYGHR